VSGRQKPAAHAADLEAVAEIRGDATLAALAQDIERVLSSRTNCRPMCARNGASEASPFRAGALIERRGLEIAPTVGRVIRVLVEEESPRRAHVTNLEAASRQPDAHLADASIRPRVVRNQRQRLCGSRWIGHRSRKDAERDRIGIEVLISGWRTVGLRIDLNVEHASAVD